MQIPDLSRFDALVLGGGLAGLTAAYQLQKQGARVAVLEERGRPGGLICSGKIADFPFDIGAEAFVSNATEVKELLVELGLELVEPAGGSWVWTHAKTDFGMDSTVTPSASNTDVAGTAHPIPHGILGIAARFDDPTYQETLTAEEYSRFCDDADLPAEIGAEAKTIAELVEARLGLAVLEKIVGPVAGGIHSNDPRKLNVDTVAPGLRAALMQTGSLVKAVATLRGEKPRGSAVCAPKGGMFQLVETLAKRILAGGGVIVNHCRALHLSPAGEDYICSDHPGWQVTVTATRSGAQPGDSPISIGEPQVFTVPQVVVALPGGAARRILAEHLPLHCPAPPEGGLIRHVSLWIQSEELDIHPRGSGILVQNPNLVGKDPGTVLVRAKALTHYTAKWDWAAKLAGPGRHLLRVSYGWPGETNPPATVEQALQDASFLLGVRLEAEQLLGQQLVSWDGCLPPFTPEHRENVAKLLQKIADYPGLDVVGSWVAGSGMKAVVPQAQQVSMRGLPATPVSSGTVFSSDTETRNVSKTWQLGTRASQLARTQSGLIQSELLKQGLAVDLKLIRTAGDVSTQSLRSLGGVGVFAATLRQALLAGECDLAVHSAKDLPTAPVPGLQIAAFPKRSLENDCLCSSAGWSLMDIPFGARVGTGSPRRASQILAHRPDLEIVDIRGNVPTRLSRVKGLADQLLEQLPADRTDLGTAAPLHFAAEPDLDAVVLAGAGLRRLGLWGDFVWRIPNQLLMPAPAQGALAVEVATKFTGKDSPLYQALQCIHDPVTHLQVSAERAVLAALQAGCAAPVGAAAFYVPERDELVLTARVTAPDGSQQVTVKVAQSQPTVSGAEDLGVQAATQLLNKGAGDFADLQATKPVSRAADA